MLNILRSYLNDAATPELRDAVIAAHASIDRIGFQNYEKDFEEVLMMDADSVNDNTLTNIVDMTKDIQRQILAQHEVTLTDTADIDTITLFINGILDIANYEDQKVLHDTASFEGSAEETFAELMALVTDRSADELLYETESIGRSLIVRIKEMSVSVVESTISDEERAQQEEHIAIFKRFLALADTKCLSVELMLTEGGLNVGYPFAVYVNILGRELEAMSPGKAARELLGMALISSDGMNSPRAVIKEHIDHCISNIDTITKIDVEIGNLLLGLQL